MINFLGSRIVFRFCCSLILALFINTTAAAGENKPIFSNNAKEADAALRKFDKKNPECELWTNWVRMCSRTGPAGATHCQSTVQKKVRPSAPFCVAKGDGGYRRPGLEDGLQAVQSSLRFCRYPNGKPADLNAQIENCEYDPTRPFNGHNLGDQLHPWCESWDEAGRVRPASMSRKAPNGFFCVARKVANWCAWADGLGYGSDPKKSNSADQISVLLNVDSLPVRGVFCRRRVK